MEKLDIYLLLHVQYSILDNKGVTIERFMD